MYWADEAAEAVLARSKPQYRVHDYKTPSGRIHVGALRGVIIHNIVTRALQAKGARASYAYGFDDYDPMDGFPVYLPESFRQYMGKPLSEIPSPEPGYDSFGQFFAQEFIQVFEHLGITPEIVWSSQLYKTGHFNEAIRIALDKADVIRRIYKEVTSADRPDDWHALFVVCPNCGKVGTTRVYAWDGQEVSFRCEPKMVTWAVGCGHEGRISPFDGNAKLPWKVEWAAKWFTFENDFETAGKDHITKGGSFDVASAILKDVYGKEPPIGRQYPYEFLLVGGKKMSSSKALGLSARDFAKMLPAHLINFIIARNKPNRQINFESTGDSVPLLYDEYDRGLVAYRTDPESDLAKVIEYTKTDSQFIPEYTMRFSKVAFLSQMPNVDIWELARTEKGSALTPEDKAELTDRLSYAKHWLVDYAPTEFRFVLQEHLPAIELGGQQKELLRRIHRVISEAKLDGAALHEKIHGLKMELGLTPKETFEPIYQIFLGKSSGPQAGWFLVALDRQFVLHRLEEASR